MTNKFSNKAFKPSVQQSSGNGGGHWDALNTYVAETVQEAVGCDEGTPAAAIGIISGIVELGKHQDPERVEPLEEGNADAVKWKRDMVAKGKATVDEEGNFHYQAAACQEVSFYVDFPSITVDKGQFFGESNPAPYRVLLGGVFKGVPAQVTKVQGYPNSDNKWVFGDKNRATKLAKAGKLKDLKNGFEQERLLELIGTPIQFNIEVFVNSAGFLQEKISNPSPIMAGIQIPNIDEDLLFFVGLNEDNEEDYVKVLTKPVREYIKTAEDYEGSKLQAQLDALESSKPSQKSSPVGSKPEQKAPVAKKEPAPKVEPSYNEPPMDFDDDQ